MITEQDLPCIGASIFDADTYASSKPTSLGQVTRILRRRADHPDPE